MFIGVTRERQPKKMTKNMAINKQIVDKSYWDTTGTILGSSNKSASFGARNFPAIRASKLQYHVRRRGNQGTPCI